jgi:hypothetical protein
LDFALIGVGETDIKRVINGLEIGKALQIWVSARLFYGLNGV